MQNKFVDLHMHSTFSDGKHSVEELFKFASKNAVKAIAITDHDYCNSFNEIQEIADNYDIETIIGVEISTSHNGQDIHMLAYGIDSENDALQLELKKIRESRHSRAEQIVEKLNSIFNLGLDFSEVLKYAKTNIGRPHIASVLIDKKIVKNNHEAFSKYLNNKSPAFVAKRKLPTIEAIRLIKEANGLSIIAHFGRYYDMEMLAVLREAGLDGIEIQHPSHTLKLKRELEDYCHNHGMLMTGGSDFHLSRSRFGGVGAQRVPYEYYEKLLEKLKYAV